MNNNLVSKKTGQLKKKKYEGCVVEVYELENDVIMTSGYQEPKRDIYDDYAKRCREEDEYRNQVEKEFEEKRQNGSLTSYDIWKARNDAGVKGISLDSKYYTEEEELRRKENSND